MTVIGEVQNATSHPYQNDLERDDYICLSGGETGLADGRKTYVAPANASVDAEGHPWWAPHVGSTPVRPGDTERVPTLLTWQVVTTIMYNIASALTAIRRYRV